MFIAFSVLRGPSVTPLDSYFFFSFVIDICSDEIYLFYFNKKIPQIMYDIHACTLVSLMGE